MCIAEDIKSKSKQIMTKYICNWYNKILYFYFVYIYISLSELFKYRQIY